MSAAPSLSPAARAVARADAQLARVVRQVGDVDLREPERDGFTSLTRSITYQQLAGRAAAAIYGRLLETVGEVSPGAVQGLGESGLRSLGFSAAKAAALLDLSGRAGSGRLDLEALPALEDEEIITRLVEVRGIGRWTAQMYLIFHLRRPDVWPVGDYGVRAGYAVAHQMAEVPAERGFAELGAPFAPHRSAAAWYCWRALELSRG
ncbi:MAG: DNA-3-methyladenine glycosylase family protein [Candidatus Dormibacteria bacterium]